MTKPSYSEVWAFSRGVQHVSQKAREAFQEGIKGIDFADWTFAASALKELVAAIVETYGLAAAELGAQWYEFCRTNEFRRGFTAIVGEVSRYSANSDTRNAIDKLFSGEISPDDLIDSLSGIVVNQTQKQTRDTILENLSEDLLQAKQAGDSEFEDRCGYARVTTSENPCAFCVLMASQGFVYKSERTALQDKHGEKYHDDCSCIAVPFSKAEEIEGYGDALAGHERAYRDADNMRRYGDMPEELRERIDKAREDHEARYAAGLTKSRWDPTLNENAIIMRWQNEGMR